MPQKAPLQTLTLSSLFGIGIVLPIISNFNFHARMPDSYGRMTFFAGVILVTIWILAAAGRLTMAAGKPYIAEVKSAI